MLHGNREVKHRPTTLLRVDPQPATVELGDHTGDGQSEPRLAGAALECRLTAQDTLGGALRNPGTIVGDGEQGLSAPSLEAEPDGSAVGRVFLRVLEQVQER